MAHQSYGEVALRQWYLKIVTFDAEINIFIYQQHFETVTMVRWAEKDFRVGHEGSYGNIEGKVRVWTKPGHIKESFEFWIISWHF